MIPFVILVARVSVGLMFAISGWHKLRDPTRHQQLVETLERASIPCPWMTGPLIATTELVAGVCLAAGFLAIPAAAALLVLTTVAIATVAVKQVKARRVANWLENFLYLPEVLYFVLLLWLIAAGPGAISFDKLIWQ